MKSNDAQSIPLFAETSAAGPFGEELGEEPIVGLSLGVPPPPPIGGVEG